jgi:phosphotransferase system HPr (HPr) family protein
MLSQEVAIQTPNGFKVRPVTKFIKTARSLKSDITLTCKGKIADSKSPSNLMALSLTNGDIVTITVNGAEEEKNLATMVELLKKLGGQ